MVLGAATWKKKKRKKNFGCLGPNYPISNDGYAHKDFTNTHSYAQAVSHGKLKMN